MSGDWSSDVCTSDLTGHSIDKNKFIKESGGGHLGIYFLLNKLEKKEKNK